MTAKLTKLKRAVIKQELVELTGDYKKAIILNQFIYWSERVDTYDKFLAEEKKRAEFAMSDDEKQQAQAIETLELCNGWIYKKAEELSEETMLGLSKSNMRNHIKFLVDKNWLDQRKNPKWKGDNTLQYRVNLIKIQSDLLTLGYSLDNYPLLVSAKTKLASEQNETREFIRENEEFPQSNEIEQASSKTEQVVLKQNSQFQNRTTLPEITSKITSKTFEEEEYKKQIAKTYAALIINALPETPQNTALNIGLLLAKKSTSVILTTSIVTEAWEEFENQVSAGKKIGNIDAYFATCLYNAERSKRAAAEGIQKKEEQYNSQPEESGLLKMLNMGVGLQ